MYVLAIYISLTIKYIHTLIIICTDITRNIIVQKIKDYNIR